MTFERLGPANGRTPVTISYAITPSENRSVRGSSGLPESCSGARYPAVPSATPVWVSRESPSIDFAMPKSMILTVPSSRTRTLAGLMSRCTMPREWAKSRPAQTWSRIANTPSRVSLRVSRTSSRSVPERNSCTKYGVLSSIPKSKIKVMLGCWSAPAS